WCAPLEGKAAAFVITAPAALPLYRLGLFPRPAVVVLVVADDQPLGHAFDLGRVAGQRLYLVRHQRSSDHATPARPLMRSLPRDRERRPQCSTPRASGSCRR